MKEVVASVPSEYFKQVEDLCHRNRMVFCPVDGIPDRAPRPGEKDEGPEWFVRWRYKLRKALASGGDSLEPCSLIVIEGGRDGCAAERVELAHSIEEGRKFFASCHVKQMSIEQFRNQYIPKPGHPGYSPDMAQWW